MSNAADAIRPPNATHVQWYGGTPTYYKKVEEKYLNQVSEQWQTRVRWWFWDINQWQDVGPGFCDRHLKELK